MRLQVPVPGLLVLLAAAVSGLAQDQAPAPGAQPQAPPAPQQVLTADQLDNLVAPIALFPDPLLGQMLVASTYPLEVVEANQWLQRNPNLKGQALVDTAKKQPWDASVQALVAVPDALAKLNQDIRWTTDLGNAFLAQQADVMNAVQRMRAKAQANGRLASTPQQKVITQDEGEQQAIVIQPAQPQVIYVPTYDPYYVWGPPLYGYYPPLYYPAYGFGFGIGFNLGFCFGGWWGWSDWGWWPGWFGHSVYVNHSFFHHHGYRPYHGGGHWGRTAWVHNPSHRMRVPYGDSHVAARFGGSYRDPGNSSRPGRDPSRSVASSYVNRPDGRYAGRSVAPGPGNAVVQSSQSSEGRRYESSSPSRTVSGIQRFQNQSPAYQSPRQYSSGSPQSRTETGNRQFQGQSRSYQPSQGYRSSSAPSRAGSQGQQYQSQSETYQQYRSGPAIRSFGSQQTYQAPQQFRAVPQASAPRTSGGASFSQGGSFSRGSGSSFSRGGGFASGSSSIFSRGGGGSFARGGGFSAGGSLSRGGAGGFSRGSSGGHRR